MKSKMVRTRGGGSSNLDRVRPTASVKNVRIYGLKREGGELFKGIFANFLG